MPDQPTPILTYSTRPRPPWRRPRLLIAVAVLLVAAFLAYRYGPWLLGRLEVLHLQRVCANHVVDPSAPAYWEELLPPPTPPPTTREAYLLLRRPPPLVAQHGVIPRALTRLSSLTGNGLPVERALFLHARRTPNGPERLVIAWVAEGRDIHTPAEVFFIRDNPLLRACVIEPATLTTDPRVIDTSSLVCDPLRQAPLGALSFDAGVPDPADPSHFTIGYQTPAGRGTIDAWLKPDDTVRWQLRDGPATRPDPEFPPGDDLD